MIDINKEVEESVNNFYKDDLLLERIAFKRGYTECAENSKFIQVEKLKFAIEAVLQFRKATFGLGNSGLEKLQQQLKELENE
jgi:hypothetical protein